MSNIEAIENAITVLPVPALAKFRNWFAVCDAAAWDAQIESDAAGGKFDTLAQDRSSSRAQYRS